MFDTLKGKVEMTAPRFKVSQIYEYNIPVEQQCGSAAFVVHSRLLLFLRRCSTLSRVRQAGIRVISLRQRPCSTIAAAAAKHATTCLSGVFFLLIVCTWSHPGRRLRGPACQSDGRVEGPRVAGVHVRPVFLHVHGAVRGGLERPRPGGCYRGTGWLWCIKYLFIYIHCFTLSEKGSGVGVDHSKGAEWWWWWW